MVNVVLNAIFIQFFNAKGAAIATIFSYTAVMVIQTIPLLKNTKIVSYFRFIPFPFISGVFMLILVRLVGRSMGISVLTVICEIVVGILFYGILSIVYLYIMKKELVQKYIDRIQKRICHIK